MIAGCFGILGAIDVTNNYLGLLNKKSKIFIFSVFLIILLIGLIINSCSDRYKLSTDLEKITENRNALKTNLKRKQQEIEKTQSNSSTQGVMIQTLIKYVPKDKLDEFRNQLFVNETIAKYKDDKYDENSKNY